MKRASLIALAVAACLPLAVSSMAFAADKERPKTIRDLDKRPVEVRPKSVVDSSSSKAMDNYKRFLELQRSDPQLRAEAMRRLGDLNLDSEDLEKLEQNVTAEDLQSASAIQLYTTLLKAYPDYPRNDQVLYQLARAYETTGKRDLALATLDRIVSKYPKSPQLDEVQFRRGELLFSSQRYQEAQRAYETTISRGSSSAYYQQSLYKNGWAMFKQGLNEESLPSFAGLLDAKLGGTQGKPVVALEKLRRADRELVEDTLRVMSITFSYMDGAASLDAFMNQHGKAPYEHLLYSRLGDLYVEKERYQDGAATYRAYVARNPNTPYAPLLTVQAMDAYGKGGFSDLLLEGKREYIERYNFNTPFWQGRDRAKNPEIVAQLKTNFKDVATHFHAMAQKSKRPEDFQLAAKAYRDFLQAFPSETDSAATHYLLAETLFESRQYSEAAAEFARTAYDYPKNEKSAAAAYAGLVAYQKGEESLAGPAKVEWHKNATEAGVKFAQAFPEHPDSAGVLTRAAEDVFTAKDLPRAISLAEAVLARTPPVDAAKQRIAWTVIAQSQFELGAFDKAEPAFAKARDLAAGDAKMRTDLNDRLATTVYRQAEAKQKSGNSAGAVDDFLRVARMSPDSKIRSTAQYDAAAQLINLKQWDRAIVVLEEFRRDFPKHELQKDVSKKLAVVYTEANRPALAAAEFERIANDPVETKAIQREALLQSADLYAKANNTPKSISMLEKFVATNPTPISDAMEARQRLADYAGKSGNVTKQQQLYKDIVKTDAQAGAARTARTKYLAAKAQLALAQPSRDAFRSVKLTAPLKTSLAAKRKSLEGALAAYKQASAYEVAEVTTAATFETAELYRGLARDLMKSDRPKNLQGDELEQYDVLLEEQAFPFEEQSINLHEANISRAKEGIYDEWVRKSYGVLAELKPARYGKTELMTDVVTSPQ